MDEVFIPLPPNATRAESAAALNSLHVCLDRHRAETRDRFAALTVRVEDLQKETGDRIDVLAGAMAAMTTATDGRSRSDEQWRGVALAQMNATNVALGMKTVPDGAPVRARWTLAAVSVRSAALIGTLLAALIAGLVSYLPHIAFLSALLPPK